MAKNRRKAAEDFGRKGEFWAAMFLRAKGYQILGTRLKMHGGEIDLLAKRGNLLVFVEVKTRKNREKLHEAFQAVNQSRIARAAQHWVSLNPDYHNMTIRFDVIGLAPFAWPMHIVDAFQTN